MVEKAALAAPGAPAEHPTHEDREHVVPGSRPLHDPTLCPTPRAHPPRQVGTLPPMSSLEDAAVELYALPREGFLDARQAIVKRLRAGGDAETAAQAAALRKPTVAAWAVNQLSRTRGEDIDRLIELGRAVGRLQRKGPRSQEELRDATRERRKQVDALVQAAGDLLEAAGYGASRATLDAVANSLEAAVRDETARDRVVRGTLDKELEPPVGFGDLSSLRLVPQELEETEPAPARGRKTPPPAPADDEALQRVRRRAQQLADVAEKAEEDAARRRRESTERHRTALKARDVADRSEREARSAEKEADVARKAADKAEQKATEARQRADRAASEASR